MISQASISKQLGEPNAAEATNTYASDLSIERIGLAISLAGPIQREVKRDIRRFQFRRARL
jgi:hypothetical protein